MKKKVIMIAALVLMLLMTVTLSSCTPIKIKPIILNFTSRIISRQQSQHESAGSLLGEIYEGGNAPC